MSLNCSAAKWQLKRAVADVQGGKRSVLVTEYMDKGDLRSLLAREELIAKFAWVRCPTTNDRADRVCLVEHRTS